MESQTSYPNIMKLSKTLNRHYYDQQSRRVNDYLSKQRVIHCSNAEADNSLLNDALLQGFNPKWYIVLRMQEPNTPKVYTRRRDIDSITKDLRVLKGELYRTLYGSGWNKKRKRTRSIWGIEYQKNLDNPHINLLIESLPYPFDSYEATLDLFDKQLPKKVKCLSPFKGDAHVQPYFDEDIFSYITKESDRKIFNETNNTIIYSVCDFQTRK